MKASERPLREFDAGAVVITESRPSEVLASLHESAGAESEYLFAARDADPADLILVAWVNDFAIGYIATTDLRADGMLVWEHVVVPAHRNIGMGRRLLFEAARRAVPEATIEIDPLGALDLERVHDYYDGFGFRFDDDTSRLSARAHEVVNTITTLEHRPEDSVTVGQLLARKPPGVITIKPTATLGSAIDTLNTERIGALIISTDGHRVEGIISERDVLLALSQRLDGLLDRTVGELTTSDVLTCTTDESIVSAMESMTNFRIRHLPVTETGQLCGIVSLGDVVKFRLDVVEQAAYLSQAGFGADATSP